MLSFLATFALSKLLLRDEEKQFVHFMRSFGQIYTGDEYHLRLGIFLTNLRYIQEHNKGSNNFKLGVNALTAYTRAEYFALLGYKPGKPVERTPLNRKKLQDIPESIDYREKKVVTPVKDQGQCGSDYIFSTLASAESNFAIYNTTLCSYSAQNFLDCVKDPLFLCYGCDGGDPFGLFNYVLIRQKRFFNTDESYPYTGTIEEVCKFDPSAPIGFWGELMFSEPDSEDCLKEVVGGFGVASGIIDATQASFQLYSKGIYNEDKCSKDKINHNIAIIGYGSENGSDYWILRNSWGQSWGEEGYMRYTRNTGDKCGITGNVFLVDVTSAPPDSK